MNIFIQIYIIMNLYHVMMHGVVAWLLDVTGKEETGESLLTGSV